MENDLISRSALLEEVEGAFNRHYEKTCYQFIHDFFKATIKRINKAPTVDAVEVVRCTDCKYDNLTTCPLCWIEKHTLVFVNHDPDFYCSYGERREENGNL